MTRRKSHAFDSEKVGWTKTVVVVVVVVFTLAYVTHKTKKDPSPLPQR